MATQVRLPDLPQAGERANPPAATAHPTLVRRGRIGPRRALQACWRNGRLGATAALASGALYGLVAGWWTPRGPVTTVTALATMVVSAAAGMTAGLAMRSRWAMLLTPLAFVVTFELVRLGAVGPTVDGPHLSQYGLLALASGRGVHGVLALAPMLLGVVAGGAMARTMSGTRSPARGWLGQLGRSARRGVAVATTVALVGVAYLVARPATTDPITGPDGRPLPGSVAELVRVGVGGHDLRLMIRGHDVTNPVLLFLAGGPGGTELGAMRAHGAGLERDFVVVTLDQRGTGGSHDQLEPTATLTLDNAVSEVIDVTNHLRERFGQDRIYLVGNSWGSTLGVLAVQRNPELFHAFVGTGQMVSQRETDEIFYADTLAWAERTGRDGLARDLRAAGPPPYDDVLLYEQALMHEHDVYPYDHSENAEGEGGMSENLLVEEYTLLEQAHSLGAMLDVFSLLYPQLQAIDFRRDATRLEVPVYLVQGGSEARGRAEPAREWYDLLDAPAKRWIVLETAGHRPIFEQPVRFHEVMTEIVLAETQVGR